MRHAGSEFPNKGWSVQAGDTLPLALMGFWHMGATDRLSAAPLYLPRDTPRETDRRTEGSGWKKQRPG